MKKYNYIYIITNKINGKIYIGKHSTNKLDDGYMGSGVLISKAKLKYGIENFTKEYLAFCDNEETLNYLEKFYIKKYKAKEIGYNLTDGGDGKLGYKPSYESREKNRQSHLGKKCSENTKQKIGEANKGKNREPEFQEKLRVLFKGHHHTEDTKKLLSELRQGLSLSDITKQKISEANKGENNPMFGVHRFGEDNPMCGKTKNLYKWKLPNGTIKIMDMANVHRWHPDWIKIGEV